MEIIIYIIYLFGRIGKEIRETLHGMTIWHLIFFVASFFIGLRIIDKLEEKRWDEYTKTAYYKRKYDDPSDY